jgi:hypothetical protein
MRVFKAKRPFRATRDPMRVPSEENPGFGRFLTRVEQIEILDREFDDQNEADILREIACGAHLGDR